MVRTGTWLLLAALVAGCASAPAADGERRVIGDANQVSVQGGRLDALPLAIAHCARFGRAAQWGHTDGDRSVYACVANP